MAYTILIADCHEMTRAGLRCLLEQQSTLKVVGETDNGRSAVQLAQSLSPHLVIMDLSIPELNGIDATRKITQLDCGTRVLAVAPSGCEKSYANALKAGE